MKKAFLCLTASALVMTSVTARAEPPVQWANDCQKNRYEFLKRVDEEIQKGMREHYRVEIAKSQSDLSNAIANVAKGKLPKDPPREDSKVIRDFYKSTMLKARKAIAQYEAASDEEISKELGTSIYAVDGYGKFNSIHEYLDALNQQFSFGFNHLVECKRPAVLVRGRCYIEKNGRMTEAEFKYELAELRIQGGLRLSRMSQARFFSDLGGNTADPKVPVTFNYTDPAKNDHLVIEVCYQESLWKNRDKADIVLRTNFGNVTLPKGLHTAAHICSRFDYKTKTWEAMPIHYDDDSLIFEDVPVTYSNRGLFNYVLRQEVESCPKPTSEQSSQGTPQALPATAGESVH